MSEFIKRAEARELENEELRELVDIMLMSIHWQGFCIDNEEVMKAICGQHEDSPTWKKYKAQTHPAGQAHKRMCDLIEMIGTWATSRCYRGMRHVELLLLLLCEALCD